jgi:type I restriction enzyme, S subunit
MNDKGIFVGEIFNIERGGSPRPIQHYLTEDTDSVPWIMIGDTTVGGKYIESTRLRIKKEGIRKSREVYPGELLLTNSMSFGRPYILKTYGCIHDGWLALKPKRNDIDLDYAYHALGSAHAMAQFQKQAAGATVKNLNKDIVASIKIPLPPLEEQRRIAAILDKAHRITLLQKDAKNAIELLPKSLFLSLFGDPRINPYSWPQYSLGELGRVVTGSTPPSSEHGMFEGTHPFVTPGDLGSGQASKRSLTEAGARRSRSVRKGSALVCCIGATIGKMDIAREDSAFNQQINAVEWGDSVIGEFGIEALRFFKDTISTAGASTTLPILKKSAFEKLRIPVPPIGLQRDYCQHLEAMSPCLARLQTAAQLGASLKQALMSKAFSGVLLR